MKTLTIETPQGQFTRKTRTAYTHVNVWQSPRALKNVNNPDAYHAGGVCQRWNKDRGFGVTWHKSLESAQRAGKTGYVWDNFAVLLGTYSLQTESV